MRIALVCDYSLSYLGGAQTAFLQQAEVLADAGHDVTVLAPRTRMPLPDAVSDGRLRFRLTIPFVQLPLLRNTADLRERLHYVLDGCDAVHCHSEFGLTAAATAVAHSLGIPVVHTVHTFYWRSGAPRLLQRPAAATIRRFLSWVTGRRRPPQRGRRSADATLRDATLAAAEDADVVVSPSKHQRDDLVAAGLSHVETVVNTITPTRAGTPLTRPSQPINVVWVGRLAPEKRVTVFVLAMLSAINHVPSGSLTATIVGDGPEAASARRLAQSTPHITFAGRLDHAATQRVIADGDVVALTSAGFDNQPMTVVEALAAARGVVYVDPALTEGLADAGILCASPSASDIAATLIGLVHAPHTVVDASRRAHDAFAVFSPERFAANMASVYRAAARARSGSSEPEG